MVAFASNAKIDIDGELTGAADTIIDYFPPGESAGSAGMSMVRITPSGKPAWFGRFRGGYNSPPAATVVATCPNPNHVFVSSMGQGYLLDITHRAECVHVPVFPIIWVKQLVEQNLLVIADFTSLQAIGVGGLKWLAPSLSADGIEFVGIDQNILTVAVVDAASYEAKRLEVDLADGKVKQ